MPQDARNGTAQMDRSSSLKVQRTRTTTSVSQIATIQAPHPKLMTWKPFRLQREGFQESELCAPARGKYPRHSRPGMGRPRAISCAPAYSHIAPTTQATRANGSATICTLAF